MLKILLKFLHYLLRDITACISVLPCHDLSVAESLSLDDLRPGW